MSTSLYSCNAAHPLTPSCFLRRLFIDHFKQAQPYREYFSDITPRAELNAYIREQNKRNNVLAGTPFGSGRSSTLVDKGTVFSVLLVMYNMSGTASFKGLNLAASVALMLALGLRNMNVEDASWGSFRILQLDAGGRSFWCLSNKRSPWVGRIDTRRKMETYETLREFIPHKNVFFCPFVAISLRRFYLLSTRQIELPNMTNWMTCETAETEDEDSSKRIEKVVSGVGCFLPMVSQHSEVTRFGKLNPEDLKDAASKADPPIDPGVQKSLNYKTLRDVVHKVTSQDRTVGIEEGKARVGHDSRNQHTGSYTTHSSVIMMTGGYNSGDT